MVVALLAAVPTAASNTNPTPVPCGHVSKLHTHKSHPYKTLAQNAWAKRRWRQRDPRSGRQKRTLYHRRACARNEATRSRMVRSGRNARRAFKHYRRERRAERRLQRRIDPPGAAYLARLRACESGGNYATNTGNGFYGAYQFDLQTWGSVGGYGYPHQAAPSEQDYRAAVLWRSRGSQPWPVCG